jgi:hypothetical protein
MEKIQPPRPHSFVTLFITEQPIHKMQMLLPSPRFTLMHMRFQRINHLHNTTQHK